MALIDTLPALAPAGCLARSHKAGALIVSLDFELHWGVRDIRVLDSAERERLLSARRVIPSMLDLFEEFGVRATWATVGFLFAESKKHLEKFMPKLWPSYRRKNLNPYSESVGTGEADDPFHFGSSLIREIARRPGQEIASHSFSHYYCMEPGQTRAEFEADLESAIDIAADGGYRIDSYVFPRNQVNGECLPALRQAGLCYRGVEPSPLTASRGFRDSRRPHRRIGRLVDSYVDVFGAKAHPWPAGESSVSLPASRYLSPYREWLRPLESLRRERIVNAMTHAAAQAEVFHLWWHPEDFAGDCTHNLRFLRSILEAFRSLQAAFGMESLSMAEAAAVAAAAAPVALGGDL